MFVWTLRGLIWFADGWFGHNRTAHATLAVRFPVGVFRLFVLVWVVSFIATGSNTPVILGTGFAVVSGLAILCFAYLPVCEDPAERMSLRTSGRSFFLSAVILVVAVANSSLIQAALPHMPGFLTRTLGFLLFALVYPLGLFAAKLAVDGVADLVLAFVDYGDSSENGPVE